MNTLPTIPLDLGNWAYLHRGPREEQLIALALANPGRIYAAIRYAEGPIRYADRLAELPPMLIEELLPRLTRGGLPPIPAGGGYDKHAVIRAQVKDGVLRTTDFRVNLTGDPIKDTREKALLLTDLTLSKDWTGKEAA